jgi:integrase
MGFSEGETASRVLQRLKAVFDSAILKGTRERANPCVGVGAELGTGHRKVAHHAALHWKEVPEFVRVLQGRLASSSTLLALQFLILTATRSGEVRGSLWSEINLDQRTWTIPGFNPVTGRRMKGGQTHVVPLSTQVLNLLREARGLHDGEIVFPGSRIYLWRKI